MTQQSDRRLTLVLSWVAGYVDTAGFVGLNGLFTAHITGNLVVAGAEVDWAGGGDRGVWVRLAVVPVFVVAVAIATIYWRWSPATRKPRQQRHPAHLLWLETAYLLLFLGLGVVLIPNIGQPVSPNTLFVVGSAGVVAMGVKNALMREALGTLAPTTVMTGNLTQFVIDMTQLLSLQCQRGNRAFILQDNDSAPLKEVQQRTRKFGSALLGFVVGAVAGALAMHWLGFWAIAFPTVATALLAIVLHQRSPPNFTLDRV